MSEEEKYFFSDFIKIRESQNITIEDIIKSTKIQEQYIHAIEKGNFDNLPLVYTRLFLKMRLTTWKSTKFRPLPQRTWRSPCVSIKPI